MNTPPLLLAAALLFWGWQTGHWAIGLAAGLALESSRLIKARWTLVQADFNRLWNICSVMFMGSAVFLFINESPVSINDFFTNAGRRPEAIREAGKSALIWVQWLPIVFFPFILAQVFNETSQVGLATFSWWLRKQEKLNPRMTLPRDKVDVSFPFVALCLLSASSVTSGKSTFYYGIALLVAWALWPVRTRRYPVLAWVGAFLLVSVAGYGGHTGLTNLQHKLEQMDVSWFSRFVTGTADSKVSRTAIGSIGRLKMSDRIVLRLQTDGGAPPEYLREASYTIFRSPLWSNRDREFVNVFSEDENTHWKMLPRKRSTRSINIAQYLRGGIGLLTLPNGSSELTDLPAVTIRTNFFGATLAEGAAGLVIYNALYDSNPPAYDSPPLPEDLRTYEETEPAIKQVADELELRGGMNDKEALKRVATFFSSKFQYSTYLGHELRPTPNETALAKFLLRTRSGHCEYFATATTLLLRKAGVPTRYAVGFSVQEGRDRKYIVRERHAHAWVLVWDGKTWVDFDTTPSSWNAIESAHASFLQPIKDFLSDVWFQFSKFRWSKTEWRKYLVWAPVPLLIVVIVRFFFAKQWKKMRSRRKEHRSALVRAGIDSDFYLIEKHFAARGLERRTSENWSRWLRRIEEHESAVGQLQRVLMLHQRHRFDPRGLSDEERRELRVNVAEWLAAQSR